MPTNYLVRVMRTTKQNPVPRRHSKSKGRSSSPSIATPKVSSSETVICTKVQKRETAAEIPCPALFQAHVILTTTSSLTASPELGKVPCFFPSNSRLQLQRLEGYYQPHISPIRGPRRRGFPKSTCFFNQKKKGRSRMLTPIYFT